MKKTFSEKGSTLLIIFILVILVYFAFFNFDLKKGIDYLVQQDSAFFQTK